MGVVEFTHWVSATREQNKPASDPDTWQGTEQDPGWDELRRKRDRMRGRP